MRIIRALACIAVAAAAAASVAARAAEEHFDACDIFTQADAETALGTTAAAEPVNPKVRRPKVITTCTYNGFKDGKPVAASVQFRFGRTDAEARGAFEDARLQYQTKPLLLNGADGAFWSAKTGQMNVLKGRTWITVTLGGAKPDQRDDDQARKLAEVLVPKI
ncbi:MAG TPA: hypothetical protein VLY46_03550 [Usitatibacter sp.]|nr:hypothetical protein [Usitatibacter sp.]